MNYINLGYIEPGKFEGMTEDERRTTFDDCFEYNDHLRANGHLVAELPHCFQALSMVLDPAGKLPTQESRE